MKLLFFTNFVSPHVVAVCDQLWERLGGGFALIETRQITEERKSLGYHRLQARGFVRAYSPRRTLGELKSLSIEADLALFSLGSVDAGIASERIKRQLPTVFLSERVFKRGVLKLIDPRLWKQLRHNLAWRKKEVWLLTMGGYVARDFRSIGFPSKRIRSFGYFPQQDGFPLERLVEMKGHSGLVRILWVGRLIDWKRPEDVVYAAHKIASHEGLPAWRIDIVGDGPRMGGLTALIKRFKLEDRVRLAGLCSPADVEGWLRTADILVTSSNRREGWGAVINEGMSRACAVVATTQSGAAPVLIDNGNSGVLYSSGDIPALSRALAGLISDREERQRIGANAFASIDQCWNGALAADRLLEWFYSGFSVEYEKGPLSLP